MSNSKTTNKQARISALEFAIRNQNGSGRLPSSELLVRDAAIIADFIVNNKTPSDGSTEVPPTPTSKSS